MSNHSEPSCVRTDAIDICGYIIATQHLFNRAWALKGDTWGNGTSDRAWDALIMDACDHRWSNSHVTFLPGERARAVTLLRENIE